MGRTANNLIENQKRKAKWFSEKEELHRLNLLPRQGFVSPEIEEARAKWYEENTGEEAPWTKFSMG